MLLKRHFNDTTLDYVEVKHTGNSPGQNFSDRLVLQGIAAGFMSIGGGKLTLHAKPEDLVYTIKRLPGHYCVHCGERIEDGNQRLESGLTVGAAHVLEKHPNTTSPDKSNPAGYERINHYECELDPEQHAKFKKGA